MNKKNKIMILTITIISLFILNNMSNSNVLNNTDNSYNLESSYEIESSAKMDFEQTSDNTQLIGGLATVGTYPYYTLPQINSEDLNHDLTSLKITRLQTFTESNTATISDTIAVSKTISDNIDEVLCSAPFDTSIILNMDYTNSLVTKYPTSATINTGTVNGGAYTDLQTDNNNYFSVIGSQYDHGYATSYSIPTYGTYLSGLLSYTNAEEDGVDILNTAMAFGYVDIGSTQFISLRFYFAQNLYTSFQFSVFFYNPSVTEHIRIYYLDGTFFDTITDGSPHTTTPNGLLYTGSIAINPAKQVNYVSVSSTINTGTHIPSHIVYVDFLQFSIEKVTCNMDFDLDFTLDPVNLNTASIITLNYKTSGTLSQIKVINGATISYLSESGTEIQIIINSNHNSQISFEIICSFGAIIYLDLVKMNTINKYIQSIYVNDLDYIVNSITYTEDIIMYISSYTIDFTSASIKYVIDTTQFTHYDYINDLTISAQQIDYYVNYMGISAISIEYFTTTSSSVWIIPSEINLQVNGITVEDETFNSGIVDLINYPTSLIFTADISNIVFKFDINSYLNYNFDLTIVSSSYFKTFLLFATDIDITLTSVTYLFDASIKHSYMNNIDYGTAKTFSPNYLVIEDSSIKIEVLLQDTIYKRLTEYPSISNYMTQITSDITSEMQNIQLQYDYSTDSNFGYWYFENNLEINDFNIYSESVLLDSQKEDNIILINDYLTTGKIVNAILDINPNIDVTSNVIVNTGIYVELKVIVTSDIALDDVTIIVKDFTSYFINWDSGATQDSFSKQIRFNVVSIATYNEYILIGGTVPPLVSYDLFVSESNVFIQEGFSDLINYNGFLSIPQYSTVFEIYYSPEWTLNNIHYSGTSYTIDPITNNFYCEGWNELTTTAYLDFYANPIDSFIVSQTSTKVTVDIITNLPVYQAYVIFYITDVKSFTFTNDQIEKLYSSGDVSYYYYVTNLNTGSNVLEFEFTTYDVNSKLDYIIPILLVGFVVIVVYYRKKQEEKDALKTPEELENDKVKKENSWYNKLLKKIPGNKKERDPEAEKLKKIKAILEDKEDKK